MKSREIAAGPSGLRRQQRGIAACFFAGLVALGTFDAHALDPSALCAAPLPQPPSAEFARVADLAPLAIDWAERLAAQARAAGTPLAPKELHLATRMGVRHPAEVRLVLVDEIPLPVQPVLARAASQVGLVPSAAGGMTLGYAVLIRRGQERDTELLAHELRHVAQYEACGGIRPFLSVHLAHLARHGYRDAPFEADARRHAASVR